MLQKELKELENNFNLMAISSAETEKSSASLAHH